MTARPLIADTATPPAIIRLQPVGTLHVCAFDEHGRRRPPGRTIQVRDFVTGRLVAAGGLAPVADWMERHGFRWVVGAPNTFRRRADGAAETAENRPPGPAAAADR
jgi:hypothetical protein